GQTAQDARGARDAYRHVPGRARRDGGRHRDAHDHRRARRAPALPVGLRLVPAGGDRDRPRLRQALGHLREKARLPGRHLPVPARERARRPLAEHGGAYSVQDRAGPRGGGGAAGGHHDHRGHLRAGDAGAHSGALRGGVGDLRGRRPRRRWPADGPGLLALGFLPEHPVRPRRRRPPRPYPHRVLRAPPEKGGLPRNRAAHRRPRRRPARPARRAGSNADRRSALRRGRGHASALRLRGGAGGGPDSAPGHVPRPHPLGLGVREPGPGRRPARGLRLRAALRAGIPGRHGAYGRRGSRLPLDRLAGRLFRRRTDAAQDRLPCDAAARVCPRRLGGRPVRTDGRGDLACLRGRRGRRHRARPRLLQHELPGERAERRALAAARGGHLLRCLFQDRGRVFGRRLDGRAAQRFSGRPLPGRRRAGYGGRRGARASALGPERAPAARRPRPDPRGRLRGTRRRPLCRALPGLLGPLGLRRRQRGGRGLLPAGCRGRPRHERARAWL
ncbi:MAG: Uncharacterized MFS-type transporter, partial [uncultured Rubrobacteraceae bacterium]